MYSKGLKGDKRTKKKSFSYKTQERGQKKNLKFQRYNLYVFSSFVRQSKRAKNPTAQSPPVSTRSRFLTLTINVENKAHLNYFSCNEKKTAVARIGT